METPLYTHLLTYNNQNRISFAMPGHKNGRGLSERLIDCDVTELAATEDLHSPGEVIKKSQKLIAQKYGAEKSYIITGGSTAAIQSMICAALEPDEILLSSPDCHMSVINTCAILGIQMMFTSAFEENNGHYTQLNEEKLKNELKENPKIKAVIVVSPDYYGMSKDIGKLSRICHENNIPLLTDQAHGAHFMVSDIFPEPACRLGADCTAVSAHKTLNALTGAAFLHVNNGIINEERLHKALKMFQTSSPSYVIAASAETAALTASSKAWEHTVRLCVDIKKRSPLEYLKNDDPTRLVLYTRGMSGFEAEKILADKFGIDIEMSDFSSVVLIATPSNTSEDFERLYEALCFLKSEKETTRDYIKIDIPNDVFSPKEGLWCETEKININHAFKRIAAETVTVYPPGVPIICSGTEISEEMINLILRLNKSGAKIMGMDDLCILVRKK